MIPSMSVEWGVPKTGLDINNGNKDDDSFDHGYHWRTGAVDPLWIRLQGDDYQYILTDRVIHVLQSKNDRRNESNHSYTIPNIRTVHSCTLKTNDLYPIDPGMIWMGEVLSSLLWAAAVVAQTTCGNYSSSDLLLSEAICKCWWYYFNAAAQCIYALSY